MREKVSGKRGETVKKEENGIRSGPSGEEGVAAVAMEVEQLIDILLCISRHELGGNEGRRM